MKRDKKRKPKNIDKQPAKIRKEKKPNPPSGGLCILRGSFYMDVPAARRAASPRRGADARPSGRKRDGKGA